MFEEAIRKMSLEDKAAICAGQDFWHSRAIPEADIPSIMMTDGPHGLRKQAADADHLGINDSVPATCFPSGAGLCSSWDTGLIADVARAIAREAQAGGVGIVLGPAINIKRSPLCGRNFEYFSEDPYLAGEMAVSYVNALQGEGVGASVKHYAVNNQETARMTIDARVSMRALREIYLYPFEQAARRAHPKTYMGAYNRVNGTYACQNGWLLDDMLRGEWGFDGFVMSDWGAVDDRVASLKAGMELQMPGDGGAGAAAIVRAVRAGELDERVLDRAVERIMRVMDWCARNHREGECDMDANDALAKRAALKAAVLLKNEGALPLLAGDGSGLCVLGALAETPIYQGGGSSHIKPTHMTTPLAALCARFAGLRYAPGYDAERPDAVDETLIGEALNAAKGCTDAVVFAGYYDTEGGDRTDMRLPAAQNELISRLIAQGARVTVVLQCGAPVEMPWADSVNAIMMGYLGGQQGGEAMAALLAGEVSPSGKLAESFPYRLEDTPCFLNFPGDGRTVEYREDIFVGYRYYDMLGETAVRFPFGHGLSYTRFDVTGARISAEHLSGGEEVAVEADVRNAGSVAGGEVLQLYVQKECGTALHPIKELKGFARIELKPGESGKVSMKLNADSFAYWNESAAAFVTDSGRYRILLGRSARDMLAAFDIEVTSDSAPRPVYTRNSCVGEILRDDRACAKVQPLLEVFMGAMAHPDDDADMAGMMQRMMEYMPLRGLAMLSGGLFGEEQLSELLALLNS